MKKILSIITALTVFAGSAFADEGMWLLPLLEKMNGKALSEAGCQLSPKQIYDINNTSLKDAIVQFGGGCTGEIISSEGLLVTNHHCGYGNIQKLSSVEHDYLKDGYWAMNRNEELPCEGLTVTFLESMQDVTPVLDKVRSKAEKKYKGEADAAKKVDEEVQQEVAKLIEKAEQAITEEDAKKMEAKLRRNAFTLEDYLEQFEAMKKMGGLSSILSMLPGMGMGGKLKIKPEDLDEKRIEKVKAIILSMTPKERRDPTILNSSRKQRIAKGAGTDVVEVNRLLKQYDQTKLMMKQMKNNKIFKF